MPRVGQPFGWIIHNALSLLRLIKRVCGIMLPTAAVIRDSSVSLAEKWRKINALREAPLELGAANNITTGGIKDKQVLVIVGILP